MSAQRESNVEQLSEWVRKRGVMALAYLEWLAETAQLDTQTLQALERLYPGLSAYAVLGAPLRECSAADLRSIAEQPGLVINETDLTAHVKNLQTRKLGWPGDVERRILEAWLGRPLKESESRSSTHVPGQW